MAYLMLLWQNVWLHNFLAYPSIQGIIVAMLFLALIAALIYYFIKYKRLKEDYIELNHNFSEEVLMSKFTIDHSNDFIFRVNKYGEITYFNNTVTHHLGYTNDCMNLRITDIFKSRHFEPWGEYWTWLKENHSLSFESGIINREDKTIPVEVSSIYFLHQGIEYNLLFAKDLSSQKEVEKNLYQAKSKAENNENFRATFLANFSHEIRTPMNAIVGFSDLILDSDLSGEQKKEIIGQIKQNSEVLLNLIDDIIDLSLIEAHNLELNKQYHRLNDLLLNIYFSFKENKQKYTSTDVGFSLRIDEQYQDFEIFTDSIRFRQVFTHLIKNAFKYTNVGYVEFGYLVAGGELTFFVKDTGPGIPQNKQQSLFENTKVLTDSGIDHLETDFGLALSKKLTGMLDGKLWLESEPGKGTTFYFKLPAGNLNVFAEKKINKTENKDWKNKIILIVDDLDYNYELIEGALRHTKARIIWAKDGKEALEICRVNQGIDIILMDIRMPVMDGYEATREIKKLNGRIPIIAQTAYALSEEREKSLRAGCIDYISKPINRKILIEVIEKYID